MNEPIMSWFDNDGSEKGRRVLIYDDGCVEIQANDKSFRAHISDWVRLAELRGNATEYPNTPPR